MIKHSIRLLSFVLLLNMVLLGCSSSSSNYGDPAVETDAGHPKAEREGMTEESAKLEGRHVIATKSQGVHEQGTDDSSTDQGEGADPVRDQPVWGQPMRDPVPDDEFDELAPDGPVPDEQVPDERTPDEPNLTETDSGTNLREPEQSVQDQLEEPQETSETQERLQWDGDNTLTFSELYASVGVRGIELSDKVQALSGKEVEMSGFMAPPLTAGVRFFVLTKALMAVCPFCSTDADWPTDIVVVYLPDGEEMNPTERLVKVTGKLDTGSFRDDDTGFVSLVRIYADKVEVLK